MQEDDATRAHRVGYERGYNHANYSLAYQPNQLHNIPDVPWGFFLVKEFFLSGWEQGVSDYLDELEAFNLEGS